MKAKTVSLPRSLEASTMVRRKREERERVVEEEDVEDVEEEDGEEVEEGREEEESGWG